VGDFGDCSFIVREDEPIEFNDRLTVCAQVLFQSQGAHRLGFAAMARLP
jgi:hypothetical protein